MTKRVLLAAALLAFAAPITAMADPVAVAIKDDSGAAMTGDPTHGGAVFKQCAVCHSIKAGENRVGPSLSGIIGRTSGQVAGYNYSAANKNSGIVWSEQQLFSYLLKPQAVVPGTKMTFPGLPKPQDRADVIAYLQENAK